MLVKFKAKPRTVYSSDGTEPLYEYVQIPTITSNHVDMHQARSHPKYRSYANSDLFPAILKRACAEKGMKQGMLLRFNDLPEGVTVDQSGFLAVVTFDI